MDNATQPFPGQKVVGRTKTKAKMYTNENVNTNTHTYTNNGAKTKTYNQPFTGQKVVERALGVVHGEEAQVGMVLMTLVRVITMMAGVKGVVCLANILPWFLITKLNHYENR